MSFAERLVYNYKKSFEFPVTPKFRKKSRDKNCRKSYSLPTKLNSVLSLKTSDIYQANLFGGKVC